MSYASDALIDTLERENAKLKRENEVLHEDCQLYKDLVGLMDHPDKNQHLLRLIRIMYYCGQGCKDCDQCAINGADMHVELDESCYCDELNEAIKRLDVLDRQSVIKFDKDGQ